MNWYGQEYVFSKGHQADAIRVMWENWESGCSGVSEMTIGEKIEASLDHFKLSKVFRSKKKGGKGYDPHPAWGTLIQPVGKGFMD